MSRPRRAAAAPQVPSVTLSRSGSDVPEDHRKSIKLTVKMPSSKLREVTTPTSLGQNVAVNSRDRFEVGQIMTGKRSTRAQDTSKLKEYSDSEESDASGESEEVDEEDSSPRRSGEVQSEEDASGEEDEESYDEVAAPQKVTKHTEPTKPEIRQKAKDNSRPSAMKPPNIVLQAAASKVKSVTPKEIENDDDEDEELSELESTGEPDETNLDAEGDEDDLAGEEDAEGDVDIDMDGEGEEGEGELDSDSEAGSGTGTPNKAQTKRQRGTEDGAFLALPMEPQIKKVLTADEHRMRRAEMARRRKNLSEKRNEEEKMSTINRLLKRQAPKRRGKAMNPEHLDTATSAAERSSPGGEAEEIEVERANPFFVRWINDKQGSRIAVPDDWFGKKAGVLFGGLPAGRAAAVGEVGEA